jgi:hypothetical protein
MNIDVNHVKKQYLEPFSKRFQNEIKVIDFLINKNFNALNQFDWSYFDKVYGKQSGDNIFKNAKLRLVHQILTEIYHGEKHLNEISFDTLEKEFLINIEDVEDSIFEGQKLQLFQLSVDYEMNLLKILYVRKFSYSQDDIETMKKQVSELRQKIKSFANRIDELAIVAK